MITPLIATAIKEYISPTSGPAFAVNASLTSAGAATLSTNTGSVWNDVIGLVNSTGSSTLRTAFKNLQKNASWTILVNGFNASAVAALPPSYAETLQTATNFVLNKAQEILGGSTTDVSKLITVLNLAEAYTSQVNEYVNAANNATEPLSSAHWNMNLQTTNGLSGVNIDFINFGSDLVKSGYVIDFTELANLGNPGLLLSTIKQYGGLYLVTRVLNRYGLSLNLVLDPDRISQVIAVLSEPPGTYISTTGQGYSYADVQEAPLIVDRTLQPSSSAVDVSRSKYGLTPAQQKLVYRILQLVVDDDLELLKGLLAVTTDDIKTAADLLDPKKLFPNSYRTLTVPVAAGYKTVYVDAAGTTNPLLQNFGLRLDQILPTDIAIANDALSRSLLQVKSIFDTNPIDLGNIFAQIETNKGLTDILSFTQPVPASVVTFYQSGVDNGSGANGEILIVDVIGSVAGHNITAAWQQLNSTIQTLETAGSLNTIYRDSGATSSSTGVFRVMKYALAGAYTSGVGPYTATIPVGVYGAGTYDNGGAGYITIVDLMNAIFSGAGALPGLISIANGVITSLASTYSTQSALCNTLMSQVADQMISEYTHQTNANIEFAEIASSRSTVLSFGQSLYNYAQDTSVGGMAYFLENISNISTLGGQATIAAMREARNYQRLQALGFEPDTVLDTSATKTSASLSSSQYTASEASGLVVAG